VINYKFNSDFKSSMKTFITEFVLVPLSFAISDSDPNNASIASTSFQLLSLLPSGGSNRFALICAHFGSITVVSGPLRGSSHLFDLFLSYVIISALF
jgi:hypothetical protein